jgi:hypothetical protein
MIESSRRHGHFDTRWDSNRRASPRAPQPGTESDSVSIQDWENEGGLYSTNNQTDTPTGLEWRAFSSRNFPGRRRHSLEAITAYDKYRTADMHQ